MLFWIIVLFALAVGLVVAARYNDGYALIVLPPYRVEISLNLLLLLLAGAFAVIYSLVRLVSNAVQMPARVREYRVVRKRENARASLLGAIDAYFDGRYTEAEQAALHAISLGEDSRLAGIVAERSAHALPAAEPNPAVLLQAGTTGAAGVNASE